MAHGPAGHLLQPLHAPLIGEASVTPDEVDHLQDVEATTVAEVVSGNVTADDVDQVQAVTEAVVSTNVVPEEIFHLQEVDESGVGGTPPEFGGTPISVGVDPLGTVTVVTKPTGTPVGALLFIIVDIYHPAASDATGMTVAGFTKVGTGALIDVGGSHTKGLFWRIADGTEGTTFTVTHINNPSFASATCRYVTGTHLTAPINAFAFGTSLTANSACPEVTTTAANCLVITNKIAYDAVTFSVPSGYTGDSWTYDSGFGQVWSKDQAAAGATGTPTSTHVADNMTSLTFAIAPAAAEVEGNVTPDDVTQEQVVDSGNLGVAGLWPTTIDSDSRHILDQNGERWIMRGDAGWSLFVMLDLADAAEYLDDRVAKGYNTVMVELIEHFFGGPTNINGDSPFTGTAFSSAINNTYFNHVDAIVQLAYDRGITLLMFPAYFGYAGGNEGWAAEMLAASNANMTTYGTSIGTRYASFPNIIWCAGGDWNANATALGRMNSMMVAIAAVSTQLMTAHCAPGFNGAQVYNSYPWFEINNVYGSAISELTVDEVSTDASAYPNTPTRPLFYIEGGYESEGSPEYTDLQMRKQAWGSILAGCTAGHVFGNNPIWHFESGQELYPYTGTWQSNLDSTSNLHMAILWDFLVTNRWQDLEPDRTDTFLTSGESTLANRAAASFSTALGVVYIPTARSVVIDETEINAIQLTYWLDPTSGDVATATGSGPGPAAQTYTTPGTNDAGDADWILVIEGLPPAESGVVPADADHVQAVDTVEVLGAIVAADVDQLQVVDDAVVSTSTTAAVIPEDATALQVVDTTTLAGPIAPADVVQAQVVETSSAFDPSALQLNITFTVGAPQLVPGEGTAAVEGPDAPVFVARMPGAPVLASRSASVVLFHGNPGEPEM